MNYTAELRLALAIAAGLGLCAPARAQDDAGADGEATQLETITVTGTKPELKGVLSPGEVSVVYPDDVKGEHKALPDLLDQIPGVWARRVAGTGQYTTASIRGSSPSQVNIYIDGVPYNTASESATDLSTIPMSNVERVEVYRGTTPARFSGAPLGGAINIVTKRPDAAKTSVSAGARSFGGRQASGSVSAPLLGGSVLFGVDAEESKGDFKYRNYTVRDLRAITFPDGAKPDDPGLPVNRRRLNNAYEKANGVLKWQNDNLFAKWSYNEMERFMPTRVSPYNWSWEDAEGDPGIGSQRRRQRIAEHNGAVGWRETYGDLSLGLTGTFMDQSKRYRNLDAFANQGVGTLWSDYRTRRYGIAGDAGYEFGKEGPLGHRFEVHAEYLRETLYADANDRISSSGYETDLFTRFPRERGTIQAQDTITIRPLGDLQITPVGRLEKLQGPILGSRLSPLGGAEGDYGWKPTHGLSAKKQLLDGWEAFANTGTYNRYPSFYEIYGDGVYISPNIDSAGRVRQLKREHGRNFDAGLGWTGALAGDWKGGFRLTYFQRKTQDAITFFETPVGSKYINSGTTFTRGLEFEGNIAFGDRADLHLAGTVQEGRYVKGTYYTFGAIDAAERVDGKLKVLQIPDFSANARLNLHFLDGALTTFAEVRHVGNVYYAQFSDGQTYDEPLTTIDVGAHYKFQNGLKTSAGVIDMFDRGPKQRMSDYQKLIYDYCTPSASNDCMDPNTWPQYRKNMRPNVSYPQQGRTLYLSAGMTF
ncbi:TonB-dependent receptor [Methylopila sp. M107]|uniref:TonB-dependent receptor plug domain-containing protein n=1 Tax=Methylopila sp. M107 TaxID=1101190 RepID=UPI00035E95AF|nr:TonB-dependent receptor [Methylopila sp. M107]